MRTVNFSEQGTSKIPSTQWARRRHHEGDPHPGAYSYVYFCPDCLAWQVDVLESILRADDNLDALHEAFASHDCPDPVWIFRFVEWTR